MAATVSQNPNYPTMFRAGIVRSTEHLLGRIQQSASYLLPSENLREQVLHTLNFALIWDDAWPVARDLLLQIAPKMEQAGYRKEWMPYLQRGRKQSQKQGDVEAEAELCFHLGVLYQYQAEYDEACRCFESSAAYFEKVGDLPSQVRTLNRLAYVARQTRLFEKATQLVDRALLLCKDQPSERAYSYFVQGAIAYDQRAWQKARIFFEKSLALWEEKKDQRMIAWGLINLGAALWRLKEYQKSRFFYEKAIKLFDIIQDPVHLAAARMNLGIVYFVLKRPTEALNLYLLAEPIFRRTEDWIRLAMINNNKGMTYQKLQQWDNAENAYRLSIKQWQDIGNVSALVNVMDNLGLVYLEQNKPEKAIVTFQNALDQLTQIENEPDHDYLFNMITKNLQIAMNL